jgi:hypothetical protein
MFCFSKEMMKDASRRKPITHADATVYGGWGVDRAWSEAELPLNPYQHEPTPQGPRIDLLQEKYSNLVEKNCVPDSRQAAADSII